MNIMNKWNRLAECLFRLFDPSDSPVEEEVSRTGPSDFEEILILTSRIGLGCGRAIQYRRPQGV